MHRPKKDLTSYKTLWGVLKEQCGRFGLTDISHNLTSLNEIMDKIEIIHNPKLRKKKKKK
jgi:hypothetical protein